MSRALHAASLTLGLACAAVALTAAGALRGLPLTDAQRARTARLRADVKARAEAWLDAHDPAGVEW